MHRRHVVLAVVAACLTGCTATGARFREHSSPAGKSLIYVYRNGMALGAGGAWELYAHDRYVTKITNDGYYDFVVDPGQVKFESLSVFTGTIITLLSRMSGKTRQYDLEAKPDQTYFFKFEIGDKMAPVTREEAIQDMAGKSRFDGP